MRTVDIVTHPDGTITATLDGKPALLEDAVAEWNRQRPEDRIGFGPAILAADRARFEAAARVVEGATTSALDLDAIEAAAREDLAVAGAATEGPWAYEEYTPPAGSVFAGSLQGKLHADGFGVASHVFTEDAPFFIRARTSVPKRASHALALCAAVRDHADDLAEAQAEAANAIALYRSQSGEVVRLEALVAERCGNDFDQLLALNAQIRREGHAVFDGWTAGDEGMALSASPYSFDTPEGRAWKQGHVRGEETHLLRRAAGEREEELTTLRLIKSRAEIYFRAKFNPGAETNTPRRALLDLLDAGAITGTATTATEPSR